MVKDVRKRRADFFDDNNFPKGFRRSGCFTILEAEFLQQNGHLMQALFDGQLQPETREEHEFVDAFTSDDGSELLSVKVWRKYQAAILGKKSERIFMSKYSGQNGVINV